MKDELTERLWEKIKRDVPIARETDRAAANSCTLSYQSMRCPNRHVWIDTRLSGPGVEPGGIGVDLEDWSVANEWDNAIARVRATSLDEAADIVGAWLSGDGLDEYANVSKEYTTIERRGPGSGSLSV